MKEPILTRMNKGKEFCNFEAVAVQVRALMGHVHGMAEQHRAAQEVERILWRGVLALGRALMAYLWCI